MASEILTQEIIAGVPVIRFKPSPAMLTFAATAFCDPAVSGKSWQEICSAAGISNATYKKFLDYEPHFSEWLETRRMQLGGKNKRALLEAVGMDQALKGEFTFWKPLAIREGVIERDGLTIGVELPSNLSAYKEMSDEQLEAIRNSMLASLRGVEDAGAIDLAPRAGIWEPESDSSGASPVQQGPLEISDEVGADREFGIDEF